MPRRYVARNHPAMPKAPLKGIRLCLDFPDVGSMLEFRDRLNKDPEMAYHMEGFRAKQSKLHVYKLDFFDIKEMPIGNHYYMAPHSEAADERMELTKEIIRLQTTNYEHRK